MQADGASGQQCRSWALICGYMILVSACIASPLSAPEKEVTANEEAEVRACYDACMNQRIPLVSGGTWRLAIKGHMLFA